MEIKKELIVTQEWLEEIGAYEKGLQALKKYFPNSEKALEVLKRCKELGYIDCLPPIFPPLVLSTFVGNLFYPNNVYIKGDVSTQGVIRTKGNLKIDGKLTVNGYGHVYSHKNCVNADKIDISGNAYICSNIKTNSIIMSGRTNIQGNVEVNNIRLRDFAEIFGRIKAKVINFKGGSIIGDVDADEIINDGGLIRGDVNTIKIDNINGGKVDGKITYKHFDEHK